MEYGSIPDDCWDNETFVWEIRDWYEIRRYAFGMCPNSLRLRNDREFVLNLISFDVVMAAVKSFLEYAIEGLRADRTVVMAAVKSSGAALVIDDFDPPPALKYAHPDLQADPEVVMAAVNNNWCAIKYAHPDLQSDPAVAMVAVKQDALAVHCIHPDLKADREVVMATIKHHGGALTYVHPDLQKVVMEAVMNYGLALYDASPRLRADREVRQYGVALEHASPVLKNDFDIIMAAVTQHMLAFVHASKEMQAEPAIFGKCISSRCDNFCFKPTVSLKFRVNAFLETCEILLGLDGMQVFRKFSPTTKWKQRCRFKLFVIEQALALHNIPPNSVWKKRIIQFAGIKEEFYLFDELTQLTPIFEGFARHDGSGEDLRRSFV